MEVKVLAENRLGHVRLRMQSIATPGNLSPPAIRHFSGAGAFSFDVVGRVVLPF